MINRIEKNLRKWKMEQKYNKAIIIGLGKIAFRCAEKIKRSFSIEVELFDVNDEPSRFLSSNADKCNIKYLFGDKQEVFDLIEKEESAVLLLSVYNPLIIPANILDKPGITAVNLHHSLLPFHPGMYSEAWAVFEQDEYSGITWHFVTPKIDAGDIIIQKKVPIKERTTSYSLLYDMNEAAYKAFEEILPAIMNGSIKAFRQPQTANISFHHKKDKPNDGILDLSWDIRKISSFLRAYDYFAAAPFGSPTVKWNGEMYTWKKYKITPCDTASKKISVAGQKLIAEGSGLKIVLTGLESCGTCSDPA